MFLPGRREASRRPNNENGRKNSMTLTKQRPKISPIKSRTTLGPPFDRRPRRQINDSLRGGSRRISPSCPSVALTTTTEGRCGENNASLLPGRLGLHGRAFAPLGGTVWQSELLTAYEDVLRAARSSQRWQFAAPCYAGRVAESRGYRSRNSRRRKGNHQVAQ